MKLKILSFVLVLCTSQLSAQEISSSLSSADRKYIIELLAIIKEDDQKERSFLQVGTMNSKILKKLDSLNNDSIPIEKYINFSRTIKRDLTKKQIDSLKQIQHRSDYRNYRIIKQILKRFGYPSPNRLGVDRELLFAILLHPPSKVEPQEYLDEMSKLLLAEVHNGNLKPIFYARFYDNIVSKILRKPTLYGTGRVIKNGKIVPPIIKNLESTNWARQKLGLKPLKDGEYRLVDN